jgi:membrane protease YdiL (CAAX protease family)
VFLVVAPSGIPGNTAAVAALIMPAFAVMLLGPSLASLSMTAMESGRPGLRALLGRFGKLRLGLWYAAALITPAVLLVLAIFGSLTPDFVPAIVGSPDKLAIVLVSLVWGLGAGFFEELGWTGFATPHLLARYGWLKSGIVLGAVWGTWHLFASYWGASASWGDLYGWYFVIWCIGSFTAFRVLMTWAYSRTGSLLLAQLMHASFTSGQALLSPPLPPGVTSLVWYVMFAAILWLVVTAVVLAARVHVSLPVRQPHPKGAL